MKPYDVECWEKEMRMNGNRNTMHKGYWQNTRREEKQKEKIKARNRSEKKRKEILYTERHSRKGNSETTSVGVSIKHYQ